MPTLRESHLEIPKYLELADQLKEQIESGILAPGDRLPSFFQMRAQFGAAQNTSERVFVLLEKEGLIVREPSRGTFVATTNQRAAKTATGIIGICGSGFSSARDASYWSHLVQGAREASLASHCDVLLLDHLTTRGWEKADGVLVCN